MKTLLCAVVLSSFAAAPAVAETLFTPSSEGQVLVELGEAAEASWVKVVRQVVLVPRGLSTSPAYDFGPRPALIDALKVEFTVARGDVCGARVAAVDVLEVGAMHAVRVLPNARGEVALPHVNLQAFAILVDQPTYIRGRCTMHVSVLPQDDDGGTDPDPTPGDFELAGVITYQGGFQHRLELPIAGEKVKRIWARIPAHCAGAEILEAGTVSEGHYDPARLVDPAKLIFAVAARDGVRAGALSISLNGPTNLSCDIPLYVEKVAE